MICPCSFFNMSLEIERKFLVDAKQLPDLMGVDAMLLQQGYLGEGKFTTRARLVTPITIGTGESYQRSAFITVKGRGLLTRKEYEYEIPCEDCEQLLSDCETKITKIRYRIGRWELDYFPSLNFHMAEIELTSEDEVFEQPAWILKEVTDDKSYTNVELAKRGK